MNQRRRRFIALLLSFTLPALLAALALPHTIQARPMMETFVGGPINSNTTWTAAGSPYVVTSFVDVNNGATLTIEAGVEVRFNIAMGLDVNAGGNLVVAGAPANPVVFTSAAGSPAPGDWYYINVYAGGAASLNQCEIAYGGRIGADALRIYSTQPVSVSNCDIHHNLDEGVYVGGAGVKPSFSNVTIRDNGDGAVEQDGNTEPSYDNVSMTGNGDDGIYLIGDYSTAVVLDGSGLNGGKFVAKTGIDVYDGGVLTFTAGTTLKFPLGLNLDVESGGRLSVNGAEGQPVIFTSNEASPLPGDWYYINVYAGGAASLDHCEIAYAGRIGADALRIYSTQPVSVSNCDIHHNLDEGVEIGGGAGVRPSFSNVTIRDNGGGAVAQGGNTEPTYANVTLSGNGDDGIVLTGDYDTPVVLDGSGLNGANFVAGTDIDIYAGGVLTFTPGTTLTFPTGLWFDVNGGGRLWAAGTAEQPVVFTSNQSPAAPGDWYNIDVEPGGEAFFDHCEIAYGGRLSDAALRPYSTGSVSVSNCDIHHNLDEGVEIGGGAGVRPSFSNVTIRDNGGGAVAQGGNTEPTYANVTLSGNGDDGIFLTGDYNTPVVLDGSGLNGANFVVGTDIDIYAGGVLTFTPGTTLTFPTGLWFDVNAGGRLWAAGTAEQPVVFTSNAATPAPGDWYNIDVEPGGGAFFDHCEIAYGGRLSDAALRPYSTGSVSVSNCDIHHNLDEGVEIGGGAGVRPSFSNATIRDNGGGAVAQGGNTEPTYANITLRGNGDDGIFLIGDYNTPVVLDGSGLNGANFVAGTDIDINAGGVLTFTPGTTLTFPTGLWFDVNSGGRLWAAGTAEQPVVFTSNAATPAPGDWYNINVYNGGAAAFEHCEIAYGGRFGGDAVRLYAGGGVTTTIDSCDIHDSLGRAVSVNGSVAAVIVNSMIHNNSGAAVLAASGADVTAINNTITANDVGLDVNASAADSINNIISHNATAGVRSANGGSITLSYNNLYNPAGVDYAGMDDQTGLNGNLAADPRYADLAGRNYNLSSGSVAIDSGTSDGAPAADFLNRPRYDDPAVDDIGAGALTYYDMGALERQLPSNPVNLLAESAGVDQTEVNIGDTVTISWTVRNDQAEPAEGEWVDAVFASQDRNWDVKDTLVGELERSGGLAAGAVYSGQVTFTNPPSIAGDLYFIIRSDARQGLRETIETDNEITVTVQLTVPQLIIGQPLQGQFTAAGEAHYYQIMAPTNRTLSVTVDSAAATGSLALFLSQNAIPTPEEYEARSPLKSQPDQQVILPQTGALPLYLMVKAQSGLAATAPYTLTADMPGFKIRGITPATGGNTGPVTLQITAADLTRWTEVTLIDESLNVLTPEVVYFGDKTRLFATFDLTGASPGSYAVRIRAQEDSVDVDPSTGEVTQVVRVRGDHTLEDGFTVTSGGGAALTTRLLLPGSVRLGRVFPFQIEVVNSGDVDVPSPLILVRSPNDTPLSPSQLVGPDDPNEVQLLILSQLGDPTTLPPGERILVSLYGLANKLPSSQLTIQDLSAPGTALDWAAFEAVYRYEQGAPDWAGTWVNFQGIVGDTWDEYHQALHLAAAEQANGDRLSFVLVEELIDDLLARAQRGQSDLSGFEPIPTGMEEPFDLPDPDPALAVPPVVVADPTFDAKQQEYDGCAGLRPRSPAYLAFSSTWVEVTLLPYLLGKHGSETETLFYEYVNLGHAQFRNLPESSQVVQGSLLARGLKGSVDTKAAVDNLVKDAIVDFILRLNPKHPLAFPLDKFPPDVPVAIDIKELMIGAGFDSTKASEKRNYADLLEYVYGTEIPGALIGGIGKTDPATGYSHGSDYYLDDTRKISGVIWFTRRVNNDGKTVFFNVRSDLHIDVKDTLDFCPGNIGEGLVRFATTPLSLLEANDLAHDVGLQVSFKPFDAFSIVPASRLPKNYDPDPNPAPTCEEGQTPPECSQDVDDVTAFFSSDPNDITGPAGFGPEGWITPDEPLPYLIRFENDPDVATAAAQEVFITNKLDPDMDWSTFELVSMGFGSAVVQVPPGRQAFETFVQWSNEDGSPLLVEVKAGLDLETGTASWSFRSLDPATGLLPLDPLAGFLPVNDPDLHTGEGFVSYLIEQKAGLAAGTVITNQASIVFDINDPILTNVAVNTIDKSAPTSTVAALPETTTSPSFSVSWSGTDAGGSGIAFYDLFVSTEGGPFTAWLTGTTATEATFNGHAGLTYGFYSVATDNVGYRQDTPEAAQASTTAGDKIRVYVPVISR